MYISDVYCCSLGMNRKFEEQIVVELFNVRLLLVMLTILFVNHVALNLVGLFTFNDVDSCKWYVK